MTTAREITLRDIFAARARIAGYVTATPLRESEWLSSTADARVFLKLESLQLTNSFKIRGAMNAALRLIEGDSPPIVVTASAGNHGRALALAADRLGLHAIVFTPAGAPETKKTAIRRLGAELRDDAPDYDAAERLAREYANEVDAIYISPYNHPDVIAGAGTLALEIVEAMPAVDVVVLPLGGGGLASGVAIGLKGAAHNVTVVGVEVEASRPFATAFERGEITPVDVGASLADGLTGNLEPGSVTFPLVRQYVDRLASVSEDDLRRAIRGLAAEEHVIAEGAGATAAAAVLSAGAVRSGQQAVVLVTGSNIDLTTFARVIGE
jgi:threonine dehydratase